MAKQAITSSTDLNDIVNVGDRVRVYFSENSGHLDCTIDYVFHDSIEVGDPVNVPLNRNEISHINIKKRATRPEIVHIEGVKLECLGGEISVNGTRISPALISAVAAACGWSYKKDPTTSDDLRDALFSPPRVISFNTFGFVCGCVTFTHAQLEEAIDWCATQLGWW